MVFETKDSKEEKKEKSKEKKSKASQDDEPGVLYWNGFWVLCIFLSTGLIIASCFCNNVRFIPFIMYFTYSNYM